MRKIKVGIIQQSNTADIKANLMNLAKSIEACAAHGAQLIVLQELHNSLYFCQTENTNLFDLAEPIPGPSTGFYSELAAANKVVLVTSLFEKRAPGLYHNTAVVFDRDGSIAGKYRKMHIPDDPAYYEKFYFTPGDIGFEPIQTSLGKLGVLVCWDQWYPEAARLMALKGAELLIYPTAIGWESSDTDDEKARQLNAWIISQRAHAVANGLPVISVNRVGHEPDPSHLQKTDGVSFRHIKIGAVDGSDGLMFPGNPAYFLQLSGKGNADLFASLRIYLQYINGLSALIKKRDGSPLMYNSIFYGHHFPRSCHYCYRVSNSLCIYDPNGQQD